MIRSTASSGDSLRLVVPSAFIHLERLVDETEAFLAERVADEDLAYRVVLLASEAATNAMEHGNAMDVDKQVTLDLHVEPERIVLCVEDEGAGFDPEAVDNPLQEDHLFRDSGRGIYLMEHMADEVAYENEGRRVRIVFYHAR